MQTLENISVSKRLELLAVLYKKHPASDFMARTVDKMLEYEVQISREQLTELQHDLADYEQQYGLTSSEFYQQFQSGETDDCMDYVEWASLFQMAENLQERLYLLASIE
jgi:hypothetical protein